MDSDRILELIDNVLPFEVCLYYRVIPLKVTADRIQLGMVEPEDDTALDYLKRLFQHVDRAIVPNGISADVHQLVMSQYLSRLNQQSRAEPPSLDWLKTVEPDTLEAEEALHFDAPDRDDNGDRDDENDRPSADFKLHEIHSEPPNLPVSMLVMLPPDRLLPALLSRVLSHGIGRLFFERREKDGSILYSQDGVQQAVLDALPLDLFEATLDRLKQVMDMDLDADAASAASPATDSPRESDRDFLYRDEQVLLRLRVMAGNYGEEATLQVLRGKAMEFYEEQKLAEWSIAALSSAKLLKRCVRKIRSVHQHHRELTVDRDLRFLPQLEQLLDRLEVEIEDLSHLEDAENAENSSSGLPAPSPTLPADTSR